MVEVEIKRVERPHARLKRRPVDAPHVRSLRSLPKQAGGVFDASTSGFDQPPQTCSAGLAALHTPTRSSITTLIPTSTGLPRAFPRLRLALLPAAVEHPPSGSVARYLAQRMGQLKREIVRVYACAADIRSRTHPPGCATALRGRITAPDCVLQTAHSAGSAGYVRSSLHSSRANYEIRLFFRYANALRAKQRKQTRQVSRCISAERRGLSPTHALDGYHPTDTSETRQSLNRCRLSHGATGSTRVISLTQSEGRRSSWPSPLDASGPHP